VNREDDDVHYEYPLRQAGNRGSDRNRVSLFAIGERAILRVHWRIADVVLQERASHVRRSAHPLDDWTAASLGGTGESHEGRGGDGLGKQVFMRESTEGGDCEEMTLHETTESKVCRGFWRELLISVAIVASMFGFLAGCASSPENNGSVFKANEVDVGVSSSVIER
jgi:hypothetical protein